MKAKQQIDGLAGQQQSTDPRSERALRSCPACFSPEVRKVGIKNELEIVCCTVCRTLYSPLAPGFKCEAYYELFYSLPLPEESPLVRKRLREITEGFSDYRQTNRLLDVGCGAGLLLQAAREQGWNAYGIDVSASAVKRVRDSGFEAFQGDLSEAQFGSEQFDVITAVEILEHLLDPVTVVTEIHRLLRPGGVFWLTTPHSRSLAARVMRLNWRAICPPEHLQLFSVEGMQKLLTHAGFREVRCETTGVNPLELWHASRKPGISDPQENFEALTDKVRLNEAMTKTNTRRMVKSVVNSLLNLSKLGESLKVFAIR